ncbi:MAG TPA: proline dehydrogenase, partial [Verrucomicrobiales bacterium]|nr:proline dehydrogenase [Verrucomicrobiales bacterium]
VGLICPWNFPIAIPAGGVAAALAASNTVILKPASDTALVAWELCQCFWRGGVPRTVLQFLPCAGAGPGQLLATHLDVAAVILTGGTATALRLLAARPELRLTAETGGKNATIVTALSDRELAIKHVVHSAFSHSGQKCSATSLLLLEAEVYDDLEFQRQLVDATESLRVGSAWDLSTRVGPLIRPPSGELRGALTLLAPGESWALEPRNVGDNPNLWSPGIKYGVRSGSVTHCTEFFGPVLGVMRFERLEEAIELVNATGYGLTAGLHSLDEREHVQWRQGIRAGNLYLNRSTVGAVVLRQPFGGWGRSSFGPGMKAGGPNYVAQFMTFRDRPPQNELDERPLLPALESLALGLVREGDNVTSAERNRVLAALEDYDRAWREEFSREHDHFRLLGQDNLRRYVPFLEIRVCVSAPDNLFELVARVAAARVTGARVIVSRLPGLASSALHLLGRLTEPWAGAIEFVEESVERLAARIRDQGPHANERIRFAGPDRVPTAVREAAAAAGIWLADEPILAKGRIELLWYLREQSLSYDYHRYGNLGGRADEPRRGPE